MQCNVDVRRQHIDEKHDFCLYLLILCLPSTHPLDALQHGSWMQSNAHERENVAKMEDEANLHAKAALRLNYLEKVYQDDYFHNSRLNDATGMQRRGLAGSDAEHRMWHVRSSLFQSFSVSSASRLVLLYLFTAVRIYPYSGYQHDHSNGHQHGGGKAREEILQGNRPFMALIEMKGNI